MISVVMPAYNAAAFIGSAIESILNQTFQNFEFIIVDDGSTDNTVAIVQDYLKHDKRVRLIQANHGGICHALNLGIEASQYDWIARMDADDIALPKRFERQMEAAKLNSNVVVWGTYAHHISSTGKTLSLQRQGPLTEQEFCRLKQAGEVAFVIHPTALLKKDVLLKAGGYDPNFAPAEDFELLSRMMNYGSILAIPEPLLLYRVHLQSASMQKFFLQQRLVGCIMARHQARILNKPLPELAELLENREQSGLQRLRQYVNGLGQFWYRKAGLHFAEQQYLRAVTHLSMAIAANPSYSIPRIWKQKLSPAARQALATSSQQS